MRNWKRDEIRAKIEKNPVLKTEFDRLQVQERANDLDTWAVQLRHMIELNAQAIGCKRLLDLEEQLGEVMDYIIEHANSRLGWKKIVNMAIHQRAIKTLEENRAAQRICHRVRGDEYICYCDEKETA